MLHNNDAALALAVYLLDPQPEARYTSLNTSFAMLSTAQRDTVAVLDIGDTIAIEKSFPSGVTTTQLSQELSIEGIEHTINVNTGHSVIYFTSPTVIVYEFILDDLSQGILTADNVLG